jgi:hypothetical protein
MQIRTTQERLRWGTSFLPEGEWDLFNDRKYEKIKIKIEVVVRLIITIMLLKRIA